MSVNPNSRIKVVTSISNMEINASDYIQFGTMIITIITTFIFPFIQRPMLSVDYPNYPESGSFNFNVTLANNGITALHNVKGSITIPHAAKPIEIIPDKYIPWSFAIKQDYDSHAARASFNINVLPPTPR